jgi:alkylation response protein AidB-like acyl-CoA dehydrogenase
MVVEIFNHQAIAFKLADMYVKATAKLLVMKAACEKMTGKDIKNSAISKIMLQKLLLR